MEAQEHLFRRVIVLTMEASNGDNVACKNIGKSDYDGREQMTASTCRKIPHPRSLQ